MHMTFILVPDGLIWHKSPTSDIGDACQTAVSQILLDSPQINGSLTVPVLDDPVKSWYAVRGHVRDQAHLVGVFRYVLRMLENVWDHQAVHGRSFPVLGAAST